MVSLRLPASSSASLHLGTSAATFDICIPTSVPSSVSRMERASSMSSVFSSSIENMSRPVRSSKPSEGRLSAINLSDSISTPAGNSSLIENLFNIGSSSSRHTPALIRNSSAPSTSRMPISDRNDFASDERPNLSR